MNQPRVGAIYRYFVTPRRGPGERFETSEPSTGLAPGRRFSLSSPLRLVRDHPISFVTRFGHDIAALHHPVSRRVRGGDPRLVRLDAASRIKRLLDPGNDLDF